MTIHNAVMLTVAAALCCLDVQAQPGWSVQAVYTGEVMRNADGGIRRATRYLDNLDLTASYAMQWFGEDAELFVYGLYNNAATFSENVVGDLQTVSNIDNAQNFRLYEAWYAQHFAGGRGSLKTGLIDLNAEFDAIETGGLFLNSSHGIAPDFSQSGENGPSIFPVTSLAMRVDYAVSERWRLRAGVFDAVPGDPDHPARNAISLNDGALWVAEADRTSVAGTRAVVGAWGYTVGAERWFAQTDARDRNRGVYAFIDAPLRSEAGDDAQGLHGFLRAGTARESVNQTGRYLGAGLVYTGLLPGRDADQLGLAVAAAFNGDTFKRARRAAGLPVDRAEVNLELSYRMPITDWLTLQPDLQYIIDPGAQGELKNALVLGLRFEIGQAFGVD